MKQAITFVFAALLLVSFASAYPRVIVLADETPARSVVYDPESSLRRSTERTYAAGYDDGYYDGYVNGYKDRRTTRTTHSLNTYYSRCEHSYDDDRCTVAYRPNYVRNSYRTYPYMYEVPTGYYYYERWY